jgi:hypothetical protein
MILAALTPAKKQRQGGISNSEDAVSEENCARCDES